MTKLPLFYDLEGNLTTDEGDKIDAHFKNVGEAAAFVEKYSSLYEFGGCQYDIVNFGGIIDDRATIGAYRRNS